MSTEESKSQAGEDAVRTALEHVQEAERDLEKAHELEHEAVGELHRAEEELLTAEKQRHDTVEVHVAHINEVESVKFKTSPHATLQAVWDLAAAEFTELGIEKKPKDVFQTAGNKPTSLMSHLTLTLSQAKEQSVIANFHFEIVSETGGA